MTAERRLGWPGLGADLQRPAFIGGAGEQQQLFRLCGNGQTPAAQRGTDPRPARGGPSEDGEAG